METAIVSIICIALVVFGGMTMSQGFLTSVDTTTSSLEVMSNQSRNIMRTEITATAYSSAGVGEYLNIRVSNTGQTKLADFSKWDFIVQYYDDASIYHVTWLPYTEGVPGVNQWHKTGIYLASGDPEAFEPNILNPGEEIRVQARLSPPFNKDDVNLAVISTQNGIPTSIVFER